MVKNNDEFAVLNKQDYKLNCFQEYSELVIYSVICFAIPFIIGHPQWIVGILVNSALVLSAFNLRTTMLLPVIMLPSIAILSKGVIFGPFTYLLLVMIPFIWVGNAILIYCFKKFKLDKKMNSIFVLFIGAGAKSLFLFGSAFVLYSFGALPAIFLTTMGAFQLYTALAGGALALGIQEIKKNIFKSK